MTFNNDDIVITLGGDTFRYYEVENEKGIDKPVGLANEKEKSDFLYFETAMLTQVKDFEQQSYYHEIKD